MRRSAQRGRGRAASVVAGLALLLAACNDTNPGNNPATSSTPPRLSTASPTPEPAPTLTTEDAESAAQQAVEDYLALFDELDADPDRDLTDLEQVASGRALDLASHQITARREAGHTAVGAQVAFEFIVTAVEIDPGDSPEDWYPSVSLTACVDVSDTDIVDEDGNSVVPADRPDRVLLDYTIWNVGWPDDQQWRVVGDDAQLTDTDPPEFVPCA